MDTITQPGPAEDAMTSLARPGSRPAPQFPTPIRVNGRLFFSRIALERHKAELLAWATGGEAVLSAVPAVDFSSRRQRQPASSASIAGRFPAVSGLPRLCRLRRRERKEKPDRW